jgi:DNA polymerase III epsilon subunit-like protein
MSAAANVVPIGRSLAGSAPSLEGLPGTVCLRGQVPAPVAYAVVDCETTGTDPATDEIVSLALVLLDPDGSETARRTWLVRPSCHIPAEATAVHGIGDEDVAGAPAFPDIAADVLDLLDRAVFAAHNAGFDLAMLQRSFAQAGLEYRPPAVACTLEAFRLLDPRAPNHRLESICERRGIMLEGAHEALGDVLATVSLLRLLLDQGLAPETVALDHVAYMRLRSRGDTRPASEPQVRRVFALARSAGMLLGDGSVDRERVVALVERVAGTADVEALTREQVQEVYEALERLIEQRQATARAANA